MRSRKLDRCRSGEARVTAAVSPYRVAASVAAAGLLLGGCAFWGSGDGTGASTSTILQNPDGGEDEPIVEVVVAPVPGVSDDEIRFGQSAAFSGPAGELGTNMRIGIEAAFAEANRAGGVHGRRLELVSFDDAYEPEAAIANTRRLIETEEVFALIGAVGTPTSRSATPVAAEHGVPYVAPFTGAAFLRDPKWENVINLRASYDQETEEMVERLTVDLGIERIAVMYQDDSFGRAGYRGARKALERRGMEPVSIGLYTRNTTAVKSGLLDLKQGEPEAVIIVGAYQPVASLIKWARQLDMDAVFITLSFVGSNALAVELGDDGIGVFATQVMPFPTNDEVPVVASYLDALLEHDPDVEPGFVSIEGYVAGRLAIASIEACGRELDRACFLQGFNSLEAGGLDGFELVFGPNDNQGSDAVFLTVIDENGRYRPIEALLEASS